MKKTLVIGLGVSGKSAMEFLMRRGKEVIGYDSKLHTQISWEEIGDVVVSPGVSPQDPVYKEAVKRALPIVGEVELALPFFKGPMLAITGTNGKTTVTLLVEHILNACGIKAKALGNVGTSLCEYLNEGSGAEAFVIELSSYQLETMHTAAFDAAVLLNITPDHLDRHGDMREYARCKIHLQNCLKENAPFYVHESVEKEWSEFLRPQRLIYGGAQNIEYLLPVRYRNRAKHELENILGAWLLCRAFSISEESFFAAVDAFKMPPHRIEFVRELNGVHYFDDSKGTNLDAVIRAVHAMNGPVILIAGGVDKGASYLPWKLHFSGKVKQIIVIGQAAEKIMRELHPYFDIKHADSLSSSVQLALELSAPGDCVLLSPGCASFDMFENYAQRGKVFQQLVHSLKEENIT